MISKKIYEIKVNGMLVETVEDGFKLEQGELLWQALSEQARELNINGISDENLADWQNLDDDNIGVLLEDAKNNNFIDDYEINELD